MKRPTVEDAAMLCMVVGVMMYLNTLDCGLCFDDELAIIKNTDLHPSTPWSNLLWNDFWGVSMENRNSHKSYRPLCVATFRLNYLLHELQPMGYHLVNVLLHGAVCYLYVQLCGVVFSQAVWPVLIAGLLFAVHPIHTEAVAGVVGRADVLSGVFFLVSILSYHRSITWQSVGGCCIWMVVSVISCSCAALCKELGISAAAVCLAWDVLIIQTWSLSNFVSVQKFFNSVQRHFVKRVLLVSTYIVVFMMFRLSIMKHQPLLELALNPAVSLSFPYRQLHWAYLCFYNIWLLLCPSRLSADYSMGTVPLINSILDSRNLCTLILFSFGAYLGFSLLKAKEKDTRKRVPIFGLVLMTFPFLPASNLFFPVGFVVAERVLYLPSMGFSMLVAYGIWQIISNFKSNYLKIIASTGVTLLLILHLMKTLERNRAWVSEEFLYREAVRTYPNNAKMLHNLATKVTETDLTLAEKLLRLSAHVEPKYVSAFSDLGMVLSQQNKLQGAEEIYWKAVDLTYQALNGDKQVTSSIKNLKTFTRLAKLLKQNSSRLREAYQLCENITSRLKTRGIKYPKLYAEMGDISVRLGDYQSAKIAIDTALYQDPSNIVAITAFARLSAQQGNMSAAEEVLRAAIERVGLQLPLVLEMASHLLRHHQGNMLRVREAEYLLLQVLSADPNNTEALFTLGQLYRESIFLQPGKAIKLFSQVIEQQPTHLEAMLSLGTVYAKEGRCKEAMDVLNSLLKVEPQRAKDAKKILEAC